MLAVFSKTVKWLTLFLIMVVLSPLLLGVHRAGAETLSAGGANGSPIGQKEAFPALIPLRAPDAFEPDNDVTQAKVIILAPLVS